MANSGGGGPGTGSEGEGVHGQEEVDWKLANGVKGEKYTHIDAHLCLRIKLDLLDCFHLDLGEPAGFGTAGRLLQSILDGIFTVVFSMVAVVFPIVAPHLTPVRS